MSLSFDPCLTRSLQKCFMINYLFASSVIFHSNLLYRSLFFRIIFSSADIFQNQLFRKNLSGIQSECQTALIKIRPDILLGLVWVQYVCKCYTWTTLVGLKHHYVCKLLFYKATSQISIYFCALYN